jgi:hypothetical protein
LVEDLGSFRVRLFRLVDMLVLLFEHLIEALQRLPKLYNAILRLRNLGLDGALFVFQIPYLPLLISSRILQRDKTRLRQLQLLLLKLGPVQLVDPSSSTEFHQKHSLMRQPCNLLIEPKSRLALLLGDFQLTLFIHSHILNADAGAKRGEYAIFSCVDHRLEFSEL